MSQNIYTNLLNMSNKYIISLILLAILILFIAPWYQTPRAREVMFSYTQRELVTKVNDNGERICNCDGSCIIQDSHWVPFGVLINDCSHDSYYKVFWGKEFHINGE